MGAKINKQIYLLYDFYYKFIMNTYFLKINIFRNIKGDRYFRLNIVIQF